MQCILQILNIFGELYSGLLIIVVLSALIFTMLAGDSRQACNSGKRWWKNPGIGTDFFYIVVNPIFASLLAQLPLLATILIAGIFIPIDIVYVYLLQGMGPFSGLSTSFQIVALIVIQDFLFYWVHRASHTSLLWRFHRIHHSATEVDWTTVNRIHPISLMLENALILTLLVLLGFPKDLIAFLSPVLMLWFYFVHANLNWRLGKLRFILISPVLHRWHHTKPEEGGNRNFGAVFSVWDILFGTYYNPPEKLPEVYGLNDPEFPRNPVKQLFVSIFSR